MKDYRDYNPVEAFEYIDDYIDDQDELGNNPFYKDELWSRWERLRDFFNLRQFNLENVVNIDDLKTVLAGWYCSMDDNWTGEGSPFDNPWMNGIMTKYGIGRQEILNVAFKKQFSL